ncbi:MAG: site-2 protease family protein [Desulfobacterales bacterium]|nr:site-2 protease family protein [Desulfobacterales bacterium]MCP4160943.1 site-2 protease family protein [Deltaproteobacteria bacterium]
MYENIIQFTLMIIPLILAVTVHEFSHGYAAYLFGDTTAKDAGRLTLNPVKHLDPIGSVLLPIMLKLSGSPVLFGYAKPVPVNFFRLKDFKIGTIVVAIAGPLSNIFILIISGILIRLIGTSQQELFVLLYYSCVINSVLAVFNMIPIPPLDGSKIILALLPERFRIKYAYFERFGMFLIIFLIIVGALDNLIAFFVKPLIVLSTGVAL